MNLNIVLAIIFLFEISFSIATGAATLSWAQTPKVTADIFCSSALQKLVSAPDKSNLNTTGHLLSETPHAEILGFQYHLEEFKKSLVWIGKYFFGSEFSLDSDWCMGASTILDALIRVKYPTLAVLRVRTNPLSILKNVRHTYLKSIRPLENGSFLIIDPAIRQFFWPHLAISDRPRIPEIFVGTESDLKLLFATFLGRPEFNPDQLAENYLNAQSLPELAKTDKAVAERLRPDITEWVVNHESQLYPRLKPTLAYPLFR